MNSRPSLIARTWPSSTTTCPALEHVTRIGKHHALCVRLLGIDGDVPVGADAQVSLLRQAERAGGTRGGDDRHVGERVLTIDVAEIDALLRFGRKLAHLPLAELDVHQQPQDLRIPPEAAAVRMVGGQVHAPRIVDEQQQLEPDRPLHGVHELVIAVDVRHDAAAGLVLDVEVAPLAPGQLVQQMLPRTIGGDRHRVAEQDGADVAGQVLVLEEFRGDGGRLGLHGAPVVPAVGMKLQVREVRAMALQHPHRFDRRGDVARHAEVVLMQVHRMRQSELIDDLRELRDDLRRRDALVAFDRLVKLVRVFSPLPRRDAAGIDRLDAVGLGRPDHPSDERLRLLELARLEQIQHHLVVRHQQQRRLVDDGNVVQLFVGVLGGEDRDRGLVDRRPPHPGVQISGGERGRRQAADAGPELRRVHELPGDALILGNQPAGEVERAAGHVRVNVHPARENQHAGRVDRAAAAAVGVGDDPAIGGDADVLHDAFNAVGRIVDLAARYPDHVR